MGVAHRDLPHDRHGASTHSLCQWSQGSFVGTSWLVGCPILYWAFVQFSGINSLLFHSHWLEEFGMCP